MSNNVNGGMNPSNVINRCEEVINRVAPEEGSSNTLTIPKVIDGDPVVAPRVNDEKLSDSEISPMRDLGGEENGLEVMMELNVDDARTIPKRIESELMIMRDWWLIRFKENGG